MREKFTRLMKLIISVIFRGNSTYRLAMVRTMDYADKDTVENSMVDKHLSRRQTSGIVETVRESQDKEPVTVRGPDKKNRLQKLCSL